MLAASLALCASVLRLRARGREDRHRRPLHRRGVELRRAPERVDRFAMTIRWPSLPRERRAAAERGRELHGAPHLRAPARGDHAGRAV
ncbi:MAG: hypothetical protein M5U28_07665 [Sandaracinaceae bacterium]|nr:hypothetical protein [Sandaracinaceae bacterium]